MSDQQTLATLNNQFGINGQLQFKVTGGLIVAEITNDHSQASIVLQGAQVLSWVPNGEQPVIWLSDEATFITDKTIRGGIPVCWPWFGAHPDNNEAPAHGFVRAAAWAVVETKSLDAGQTRIVFRLPQTEVPLELWPHNTELEFQVTVGARLELNLITRNKGAEAVTISQALHSYFTVSDINQVAIKGLEDCQFIDALDDWQRKVETNSISIDAEIDRIYQNTKPVCLLEDAGWQRGISIETTNSQSTVVWNPWIDKSVRLGDMGEGGYLNMLCIETGNIADDNVSIAAGAEHCLGVCYRVVKI
ncbi:MAG: D-hexose-6-phosphate mutarotase [Pseudomonadales bacterium]